MNRRHWLKLAAGVFAGLAAKIDLAGAAFRESTVVRPISIASMVEASWPAVLADYRARDRNYREFVQRVQNQGGDFRHLGVSIDFITADGRRNMRDVEQIATPVTWSARDEALNQKPHEKISLATSLLDNALDCHLVMLTDRVGPHRAAISQTYFFDRGEIQQPVNRAWTMFKIYTALSVER